MTSTISRPLHSPSSAKKQATIWASSVPGARGGKRSQAGGARCFLGFEVDDQIRRGALRVGQPGIVELLEHHLGALDLAGRDREQDPGASTLRATRGCLGRRGQAARFAQALQLLDLVEVALEEGDHGSVVHGETITRPAFLDHAPSAARCHRRHGVPPGGRCPAVRPRFSNSSTAWRPTSPRSIENSLT